MAASGDVNERHTNVAQCVRTAEKVVLSLCTDLGRREPAHCKRDISLCASCVGILLLLPCDAPLGSAGVCGARL